MNLFKGTENHLHKYAQLIMKLVNDNTITLYTLMMIIYYHDSFLQRMYGMISLIDNLNILFHIDKMVPNLVNISFVMLNEFVD